MGSAEEGYVHRTTDLCERVATYFWCSVSYEQRLFEGKNLRYQARLSGSPKCTLLGIPNDAIGMP